MRFPVAYEVKGTRGGVRARAEDILFARITPCLENGKVAQLPQDSLPAGGSTEFIVIRPGTSVSAAYVYYWCLHPDVRSGAKKRMAGVTGRMRLSSNDLASFSFQLPPPSEQRRIVEVLEDHLSRLDAGDNYLQALMRRLKDMERASLDQLFGRREKPLADLIDDIAAGKSFGGANSAAREDEWGIVKVSAMTWGQFNPVENKAVGADLADPRFEIREGDLLVSRANTAEYVGASVLVGKVRPKLLLSDKSLRLTPKAGIDARWLWRALQAPSARRQISELATGTKDSMRNISQGSLKRVLLPAADSAEQIEAIRAYEEIDGMICRIRAELAVLQNRSAALRRSLLRAAFNGELVDQDPSDEPAEAALERLRAAPKPVRKRAGKSSAAVAAQS